MKRRYCMPSWTPAGWKWDQGMLYVQPFSFIRGSYFVEILVQFPNERKLSWRTHQEEILAKSHNLVLAKLTAPLLRIKGMFFNLSTVQFSPPNISIYNVITHCSEDGLNMLSQEMKWQCDEKRSVLFFAKCFFFLYNRNIPEFRAFFSEMLMMP